MQKVLPPLPFTGFTRLLTLQTILEWDKQFFLRLLLHLPPDTFSYVDLEETKMVASKLQTKDIINAGTFSFIDLEQSKKGTQLSRLKLDYINAQSALVMTKEDMIV